MMKLYFDETGPVLQYHDGFLVVDDLNPQVQTRWRMKRIEMWWLGLRCMMAAMRR